MKIFKNLELFGSELGLLEDFDLIQSMYIRCFGSMSKTTVKRYLQFKYFPLKILGKNIIHNKILDFGCAFGGFGFMLARKFKGTVVCLYDISEDAETRCNYIINKGKYENVTFISRDELEKESGFTLTILTDVLEHIEDDYVVLKDIYKRTLDGGYVFISTPFYTSDSLTLDDKFHGHVRTGYDIVEIQNLLEEVGFNRIIKPEKRLINSGLFLYYLDKLYQKITKLPSDPILTFKNFRQLNIFRKTMLALLLPINRLMMELDIIFHGIPGDSIILLAQKKKQ